MPACRYRKSGWHHVNTLPQARPGDSALAIRAWRNQENVFVAKRITTAFLNGDSTGKQTTHTLHGTGSEPGKRAVADIPGNRGSYGRSMAGRKPGYGISG